MNDFESFEARVSAFAFEVLGLLEQLEQHLLNSENNEDGLIPFIDECFRLMHSVKSLAEMMHVSNIAELSHKIEDFFSFIRKEKPKHINNSMIIDNVLDSVDFIKGEIIKIQDNQLADGDNQELIKNMGALLAEVSSPIEKNKKDQKHKIPVVKGIDCISVPEEYKESGTLKYKYRAIVFFEDGCGMENIRAFSMVYDIQDFADVMEYFPEDPLKNDDSIDVIKKDGFSIVFQTSADVKTIKDKLSAVDCMKKLQIDLMEVVTDSLQNDVHEIMPEAEKNAPQIYTQKKITGTCIMEMAEVQKFVEEQMEAKENSKEDYNTNIQKMSSFSGGNIKSLISVNVEKLDYLMDIVGQLVIAESMVTDAPELMGIKLKNFKKSSRMLKKLINELREVVMSVRMVSFSGVCNKLNRLVRDMSRKLNKKIEFVHIGDETEVDKTIIEMVSEPLIHIIRNSVDHGVESPSERQDKCKDEVGHIELEVKNTGEEILISVKDDGRGLDKEKILSKAIESGLNVRDVKDIDDNKIYSLIFLPGFSTKENVSEYSGRGVGMDVVRNNIEMLGGEMTIDSKKDIGTVTSLKIPLTLSIIKGLTVMVGSSKFTIPLSYIKDTLNVRLDNLIADNNGNELIFIRGKCYPLLRLDKHFNLKFGEPKSEQRIVILVEYRGKTICLLTDKLYGEHQVVVKSLPKYLRTVKEIAGCSIFSDGSISLIINISELIK